MQGLKGKTFIVAGGATGIGAGTAKRLAAEVLRSPSATSTWPAHSHRRGHHRSGGSAIAVDFDLADDDSVRHLVASTVANSARSTDWTTSAPPVGEQPRP